MDTSLYKLLDGENDLEEAALPDRSAAEIRQDISVHRAAIAETISDLDERFQEAVDWRTHVAAHPYLAIGVAAGAGLLVARLFQPKPTPQERIIDALAESVEHFCGEARNSFDAAVEYVTPHQASTVRSVLLGFAAQALTGYLRGKVEQATFPTNHQDNLAKSIGG